MLVIKNTYLCTLFINVPYNVKFKHLLMEFYDWMDGVGELYSLQDW